MKINFKELATEVVDGFREEAGAMGVEVGDRDQAIAKIEDILRKFVAEAEIKARIAQTPDQQ